MPNIELSQFYMEFLGFTLTLIVALAVRDWATSFVKGMKFKYSPAFREGDKVILDGCPALIVKIGYQETVFGVYSKEGYTWRYVQNERIAFLKLEKIVDKDLHVDTKQEKAQKLVDALQTEEIKKNGNAIKNMKEK
jgi:hypothetical protein|tara:strand:- start:421 stop:828 length:408 start_codon:yes stop_codon:yes gene_type:complete